MPARDEQGGARSPGRLARERSLPRPVGGLPAALVLLAAAGYSWLAGGTRPFSVPADVITAAAYVPMAVLAWRAARRRSAGALGAASGADPSAARRGRVVAWVLATAAVVGWELVTFFSSPRALYPTGSSLYDLAARSQGGKAVVFLAWLLLGWAIVGR